jgi:polysaccharide export outer membrane protein
MNFLKVHVPLSMVGLCLLIPVVSQAQALGVATPYSTSTSSSAHTLRISSGDLLELSVFDTPELSGKLRVSDTGDILLPIAGSMRVAGMTSDEASLAIEERYQTSNILKYPHVSIFIAEYATQGINVSGEVRTPGVYPILGPHGLMDVISAAGGLSSSAGRSVTITHKSNADHPILVQINTKSGAASPDVDILPGDTVYVSRSGVVYVVGEVGKPGGFLIDGNNRLTVLQALALASGATHTSAQNKAQLIRTTTAGRTQFKVPLKQIVEGKAPDLVLEDGDILYVPSSGSKNALARGTEAAIAVTTGLIIYGRL